MAKHTFYNPQWGCDVEIDARLWNALSAHNFTPCHTGGGCMAWERGYYDGKGFQLITFDGSNNMLGTWADRDKAEWIFGDYKAWDDDGDCKTDVTLPEILALLEGE